MSPRIPPPSHILSRLTRLSTRNNSNRYNRCSFLKREKAQRSFAEAATQSKKTPNSDESGDTGGRSKADPHEPASETPRHNDWVRAEINGREDGCIPCLNSPAVTRVEGEEDGDVDG